MKIKEVNSSMLYKNGGTTTASKIVGFYDTESTYKEKFKFSYRSGNAFEEFTIEQYDGIKMSSVADMWDLEERPNHSVYVWYEDNHKERINMLMKKAEIYTNNLIS